MVDVLDTIVTMIPGMSAYRCQVQHYVAAQIISSRRESLYTQWTLTVKSNILTVADGSHFEQATHGAHEGI